MGIDIKINIDFTTRQKKVVRFAVVTGAVIAALGVGIAIAAPIDTTWVLPDKPISASSLKGDLDSLQAQIEEAGTPTHSEILVSGVGAGAAAFGAVNTAIFYYATVDKSVGSAITRSSDANAGDSYTINESGIYSVTITGVANSTGGAGNCSQQLGVSVNASSAELTTAIVAVDVSHRAAATVGYALCTGRSYPSASGTLSLAPGDVLRPHGQGGANGSSENADPTFSSFRIVKVSN